MLHRSNLGTDQRSGAASDEGERRHSSGGGLKEVGKRLGTADPPIIDKDLRSGRHAELIFERVHLLTTGEQMFLDFKARVLEHPLGAKAIGAFVSWEFHSVQDGLALSH